DQVAILFFTFFYISLLIIFYYYAKNFTSQRFALGYTFLFATTQNMIRHAGRFDVGNADLPLGYFFLCSSIFLLEFLKTKSTKSTFLLTLFVTTAALIKSEGIPFF